MSKNSRWLGTLAIVVVVIAGVGFLGSWAFGRHGGGPMGSGMMGWGSGFGTWGRTTPNAEPLGQEQVEEIAERYVSSTGGDKLEVAEIMEFDNHFYGQAREETTGRYAFEFLIDRYSGRAYPEPGPNMMWNEKYGHMGRGFMGLFGSRANPDPMTISPSEAVVRAQEFLDQNARGLQADDHVDAFYGYYTFHTLRDGQVVGMLSVNGYTGQVWLHTWHGIYLGSLENEDDH